MTTYTLEHASKGVLSFKDKKRYWWWGAILLPATPIVVILIYLQIGNPWILLSPILLGYFLIPILDYLMGADRTNPPEELVPQLNADKYYGYLLYLAAPIHLVIVVLAACLVASDVLSIGFYIAFAVVIGGYGGFSINTAHEIGHKNTKRERLLARVVLSITGYGHFCIEHNQGHHRDVSTPEDPASSRMGESIYRFALREIPGAAKRGWQAERQRLTRKGLDVLSWRNHILQSYALTLAWQGALVVTLGWIVLPFLMIHNAVSWFQLTSANYVEHYGLLREKRSNGRYERCQPHHSWNANHIFSNVLMFQLERHSDHHSNPSRPYQSLRSFDSLPELPSGYSGMYWLAYCPPLWFKVMDKRLLAIPHINGDLDKVNIDPKSEARLRARWG